MISLSQRLLTKAPATWQAQTRPWSAVPKPLTSGQLSVLEDVGQKIFNLSRCRVGESHLHAGQSTASMGGESMFLSAGIRPVWIHRFVCVAGTVLRRVGANVHMAPTLFADLTVCDTKHQNALWRTQPPFPIVIMENRRAATLFPWTACDHMSILTLCAQGH
jgi:hypothetical protein